MLELLFEDGWWEVSLSSVSLAPSAGAGKGEARARFHVASVAYAAEHTVDADVLRPRWLWDKEAHVWRYEIHSGHGCVPLDGGEPTFKFAHSVIRRSANGTV